MALGQARIFSCPAVQCNGLSHHVSRPEARGSLCQADLIARGKVAHLGQLHLVDMHQQLDGSLPDLQSGHVGQEVIAHEEAHEHCKQQTKPNLAKTVCEH